MGGIGHSLPSLAKDLLTGNPRATDIKSIYKMKIEKLSFYPITNVYLKRTNEVYIVYICRWLYILYIVISRHGDKSQKRKRPTRKGASEIRNGGRKMSE